MENTNFTEMSSNGNSDDDNNNNNSNDQVQHDQTTTQQQPTTTTFTTIPTELRQLILTYACTDLYPRRRADRRAAQARIRRFHHINRAIRAEMGFVQRMWDARQPMSLAAFDAYARAPVRVSGGGGGVLTLSFLDEDFIERPPPGWEGAVALFGREVAAAEEEGRRRCYCCSSSSFGPSGEELRCVGYAREWTQAIARLPPRGARALGIEAVEVVATRWSPVGLGDGDGDDGDGEVDVQALRTTRGERRPWRVRTEVLMRLKVLLMMRLGLGKAKVRVFGGRLQSTDPLFATLAVPHSSDRVEVVLL